MRVVRAVLFATILATIALSGSVDSCDFTAAVNKCDATQQDRCAHWTCIQQHCRAEDTLKYVTEYCTPEAKATATTPYAVLSKSHHGHRDGDDTVHKKKMHANNVHERMKAVRSRALVAAGLPHVNSPCLGGGRQGWERHHIQGYIYNVAMDVYAKRAEETYSEDGTLRWVGIHDKVCPKAVPKYSDCSSMVTWVYWTLFGNGPDFMNGEAWGAGYTGTLDTHGIDIPNPSPSNLQIGDLCFYYQPMHHVAVYVGKGKVVSHGMDPVGYYDWNYAYVDFCRRYI